MTCELGRPSSKEELRESSSSKCDETSSVEDWEVQWSSTPYVLILRLLTSLNS